MNTVGSFCEINNVAEVSNLEAGMDFRRPEYRREVFLRFYEFHTKYKAHPGAVYYAFPYLWAKFNFTTEQKLWFCFINGLCQNVITTFLLWEKCKDITNWQHRPDLMQMFSFFRQHYTKFGWDTDRRYVKNSFEIAVYKYLDLIGNGTQAEYFSTICASKWPRQNFNDLWTVVMQKFYLFGRLSTFSYLEYLKLAGLPIECNSLFLHDITGSKSHRNGLCKVLGRDDLDWHASNPNVDVKYSQEQLTWLDYESYRLLDTAKKRGIEADFFTLESTLCCYKSWHRKNRRYPNCYNDMFYERILKNEQAWGKVNTLFRDLRQQCLPQHLRVEDCPGDVGLKPLKQNHYLNTGQVIMMDAEWPCFTNDYNNRLKNDIYLQPIPTLF